MAECSFKFNIETNPAEIIKNVKSKIENEGEVLQVMTARGILTYPHQSVQLREITRLVIMN